MICLIFIFVPVLMLPGYQAILESKGINDPVLSLKLYESTIILDMSVKLAIINIIDDFEIYALIGLFAVLGYFSFFFVKLSLSIPKTSLRKFRKYPQETNYTICALKYVGYAFFSIIFNLLILFSCWVFKDLFMIYLNCFIIIVMIAFCMFSAVQALIRLDRLKYPSVRSLSGLANNNSPIVLLRSFKIDSNPTLDGRVFDETICMDFDLTKNPIISLADPDEILPSGGSLKIQSKDSDWKETVKEILKVCRAVILVEGPSDGLHWEISKLKEYLSPKQLFVMIPSQKYRELAWCYNDDAGTGVFSITRNMYRFLNILTFTGNKDKKKTLLSVWKGFSEKLNIYGIHTPAVFPGDNSILYFNEEWQAIKIENTKNLRSLFNIIVEQTKSFNIKSFDYKTLGKKIETYEVNGFLDSKEVEPFKNIVNKCVMFGRIVAVIFIGIFVIMLFFG